VNVADALLKRNLIPVLNHSNDTYRLIENEGRRAATGLLRRQGAVVHVAISHSTKSNAYTFRVGHGYVITVTDSLLRRLEEAIIGYLDTTEIRKFILTTLGIEYASGKPWPTGMTWGAKPASQRVEITKDTRIALFYEIFDAASFFSVLHEIAHIGNGDVDGNRVRHPDPYVMLKELADMDSYGGGTSGGDKNRTERFAEFDADRNAACWMMQMLLRKYVEEPVEPDPYAVTHLVLAAFGMIAAILHIAHHQPDTPEVMSKIDHPSFNIRIIGIWEGAKEVLQDPNGPVGLDNASIILLAIGRLCRAMETLILGAPSEDFPFTFIAEL
jgi:hypothetical protein